MFICKKKKDVEEAIYSYLEESRKCILACQDCFDYFYPTNLADDEFLRRANQAHSYESTSDDLRRNIEFKMYNESLIPESRGDLLGMLETIDKVPNMGVHVLRDIYKADISLPEKFRVRFKELFDINIEAALLSVDIAKKYFQDPGGVLELHSKIDKTESRSDRLPLTLTRDIYTYDAVSEARKLLLKLFISKIGEISDRAEDFADRVRLLSVKSVF